MTATVVCERHKSHVTVEMYMFELFIVLPSDAGSMAAACKLVKQLNCDIVECVVVVELTDLKGREKITEKLFSLIEFSGE